MSDFNRESVLHCLALGYDTAVISGQVARIIGATHTGPLCKVDNPATGRTEIEQFTYTQIEDIKHWKEVAAWTSSSR